MKHSPTTLAALLVVILLTACGGDGSALLDEPMLSVSISGTRGESLEVDDGGNRVTRLLDVTGDWNDVSVAIAEAAKLEGWTIERVNCVGTGNDVIARKEVDGKWLLLESGAGTRGAGVIVSVAADQRPPAAFRSTGRCPPALETAAGS